MSLLALPTEILLRLPPYICNIEDFNNLSCTCRKLRDAFTVVSPTAILNLAATSGNTFFRPHPHFLVMASAKQLSNWAIGNQQRTEELKHSFQGGMEGLLDLCLQNCGLTMERIRQLHLSRFSTLNPLSDRIDKMAGKQWYDTPDFWNGGVSEPATINVSPDEATFQFIIYGELFGSTMAAQREPQSNLPSFDIRTRLEYIKYCVPDWICQGGFPGLEVFPTGPYRKATGNRSDPGADQIALQHILRCSRWRRLWEKVNLQIGPRFEDSTRNKLWWNSVQNLGLEGAHLAIIAEKGDLPDHSRELLLGIRKQIENLQFPRDLPPVFEFRFGRNPNYFKLAQSPDMAREIEMCMGKYWSFAIDHDSPWVDSDNDD